MAAEPRHVEGLPDASPGAWSWAWSTSPRTRSPTAGSTSTRTPPSPAASRRSPRAPTSSTSAASRPGRAPSGRRRRRSSTGCSPWSRRSLPRASWSRWTRCAPRSPRPPWAPARAWSTTSPVAAPTPGCSPPSPARRALRPHALAGALRVDAAAHDVRRRGRRGGRRAAERSWTPPRGRDRAGRGSPSTRASASRRPPTRTGSCWPGWSAADLGRPVLVATSRKRFLGELLAADGELRPPRERDDATAATAALAAAAGAWCVRVHEVRATADAVRVAARWAGCAVSESPPRPDRPRSRCWPPTRRSTPPSRPVTSTPCVRSGPTRALGLRPPRRRADPRHPPRAAQLGADHGEHRLHPVLPHRRRGLGLHGDVAAVTCTENILTGTGGHAGPARSAAGGPGAERVHQSGRPLAAVAPPGIAGRVGGPMTTTTTPRPRRSRAGWTRWTGWTGSPCAGSRSSATTGSSTSSGATARSSVVDLVLGLDTRRPRPSDDLADTVDYGAAGVTGRRRRSRPTRWT